MVRVGLAPCSPFSVSRELMRDAALLARDKGVMLHTHLAENDEDIAYSLEMFGCRPGNMLRIWLDWRRCLARPLRQAQWGGIDLFAKAILVSPIAPVPIAALARHCPGADHARCRVKVGLGVDGSASNDSAIWLPRPSGHAAAKGCFRGRCMSAREALEIATLGGAQVLGGRIADR